MNEDIKEIMKSINSIKEYIKTLEMHVLDDYYNEMKLVEDWNNNQVPALSKCVPECYDYYNEMKLVEDWNNNNQVPPLSKCVPECFNK